MKYPIGIQDFEKIRNDGYVYLDKTRKKSYTLSLMSQSRQWVQDIK